MHVLLISSERYLPEDAPLSGIFQHHQAHALKRVGYRVGVISPELHTLRCFWKGATNHNTGIRLDDDLGIPVLRYQGWYAIPRFESAQMALWLRAGTTLFREYVRRMGPPDLVHAHNALLGGALASVIKRKFSTPYVLTEHSTLHSNGGINRYGRFLSKRAFRDASALLAVSPDLKRRLVSIYGEAAAKAQYVPNILDNLFEGNAEEVAAESPAGSHFTFLSVGLLIERKGHANLLSAFAQQFRGQRNIHLRVAGDGPLRESLGLNVRELGVEDQVTFLGQLDRKQVLAEMCNCDVFVHPSQYETFGVVVIEALACGRPVIATTCGGPEFIVNDTNGLLVHPGDVESLGQAMSLMRNSAAKFDPTSIRRDCIDSFGERSIVNQLTKVYESARSSPLNRRHSPLKRPQDQSDPRAPGPIV